MLKEGERIDDLLFNGLKIIQNPSAFCFGCDAVELANFVTGSSKDRAVDLGSGSGIIGILLCGKKNMNVTLVEIQPEMAQMSYRSIVMNNLQDKMQVINAPMQQIGNYLAQGSQTIVVSNPPYRKLDSGMRQTSDSVAIARHELKVTLAEVIQTASYLLSTGGKFYLIHQAERLAETIVLAKEQHLEPKVLQILTPDYRKNPHLFMMQCVKDGKVGLKILKERKVNTIV